MMGGWAFLLLKVGRPWPESVKQAEIRVTALRKILQIGGCGSGCGDFRGLWLICLESFAFVIYITVLVPKLAQYPAGKCRRRSIKYLRLILY
jgi:hypothetical protein